MVVAAGAVFVSFLLDRSGDGAPVEEPVGVVGVVGLAIFVEVMDVSLEAVVDGAGGGLVAASFVAGFDVSADVLLLLQPVKVSGSVSAVATSARRDIFFMVISFRF
jgi:hypothetical protein